MFFNCLYDLNGDGQHLLVNGAFLIKMNFCAGKVLLWMDTEQDDERIGF